MGGCVNSSASGYGGEITMMGGINADDTISLSGVEILSNSETPGLGANCTTEGFKSQFKGLEYPVSVVKGSANVGEVSAITGATITSTAVASGVNEAYNSLIEAIFAAEGGGN